MRCHGLLLILAAGTTACIDPAVGTGTGGGSSGSAESGSTSPSSSSTTTGVAEASTSSGASVGSTGEVFDGPGCEPPPPCDRGVFEGSVRIESSDQLSEFAGYTEIEGGLEVLSSDLECLDFLGCLQDVGRDIRIFGNTSLRSTDGLSEVGRIGVWTADEGSSNREGTIIISENPGLESLGGFSRMTRIERSLLVTNNESLQSITGFTSLEVASELVVRFNPGLESLLGLHELVALGDECQITNNGALCVSEAFEVCGDLQQGPNGGNTQNNLDDC